MYTPHTLFTYLVIILTFIVKYLLSNNLGVQLNFNYIFYYVTGFVLHFSIMFITLTWFLHLFHLFLAVAFPFWSEFLSEQKWKIRLHVLEVLGCVVVSSIAPIIFVSTSEYAIARFPPVFVWASRDVTFYSVVLPNTILVAIVINLTVYSFVIIRKVINYYVI